jgi:hypothetical protein
MKPGPADSETGRDGGASGEGDAIVAWGSAADGRRLDTLVRTGDCGYGLPLDGCWWIPTSMRVARVNDGRQWHDAQ